MVTEIIPTYYAAGEYRHRYTLRGEGFDTLPDDVVAVPSTFNDIPLANRDTTNPDVYMTIESRTPTEIVFSAAGTTYHGMAYIGGILSNDRTEVYWENTTRPLP